MTRRYVKRPLGPAVGTPAHAMGLSIAADFTAARTALGLSQRRVAAELGMHMHTVAAFEHGRPVNLGVALRLLAHVGLTGVRLQMRKAS